MLTDVGDSAGVMLFFPFSTEPVTIGLWKHAMQAGRYGDGAAYYSGLGAVWDLGWMLVTLLFARRALTASYFRYVIVPADPRAWAWLHRTFRLPERALLMLYRGLFFYGVGRMVSWFLYARSGRQVPFQPAWGGPNSSPAPTCPMPASSRCSSARRSVASPSPPSSTGAGWCSVAGCGRRDSIHRDAQTVTGGCRQEFRSRRRGPD